MPRRHRSHQLKLSQAILPIVHLWLLRSLIPLGGHKAFIGSNGFEDDNLAAMLGLGEWIDPIARDFEPKAVRTELRKLHVAFERKFSAVQVPDCLNNNVARLAKLLSLSAADCRILELAVMLQNEPLLGDFKMCINDQSLPKVVCDLSVLLNLPEEQVRASLSMQGILAKSGLVAFSRAYCSRSGCLQLLSEDFADQIFTFETDPFSLLRDTVTLGSPAQLGIDDYEHISPILAVLRPYLTQSIATARKGVNVFLYGNPGTGKTQLAKVLAQELGLELFEVASEDGLGDPVSGERRLRAYRAAQSFVAQRRALILFDEVEDVFSDGTTGEDYFSRPKSTAQSRKAWMNRMLENNAVPTLWLCNSIDDLDPAFIRRFDMVVELPVPPKKQRERILLESCSGLLDTKTVARIAETVTLAPAVVARASSVVLSIRSDIGESNAAAALESLINHTLKAQGHRGVQKNDANRLPDIYDPLFIHADANLEQMAAGLVASKSARLCLYGPPGTGKTAYGRWLAEQMGVPLLVKRASDLMSMWVGENEKNIARAFDEAEQDGALLLIDEVDSFLQDRRGAHRSWEVTLVNEMLAQMESFSGVFIASTNLMSGLDEAALRRFDLKVKFDFLKQEQAWELLRRYCLKLDLATPRPEQLTKLMRVEKLTPGDFAAVMRQNRFRPIKSAAELVAALEAECALKEGIKPAIGF